MPRFDVSSGQRASGSVDPAGRFRRSRPAVGWLCFIITRVIDFQAFIVIIVFIQYSAIAQWWSTRLLTDRLEVRVLFAEPFFYIFLEIFNLDI